MMNHNVPPTLTTLFSLSAMAPLMARTTGLLRTGGKTVVFYRDLTAIVRLVYVIFICT